MRKAALMKILFCAICCFSFSIGSQHDEISNQLLDFKKKIVTSYYYEEKFGSHVVSSKNEDLYKYDDEGNEIEIEKYLDNLIWYQEIKYFDYSNNLAKTIGYYLLSGDSSKTEFHYNEYNKLIEQIQYEFDGSIKTIEKLQYDISDNLIEESTFNKSGEYIDNVFGYSKVIRKYNDDNNIIEISYYSPRGELTIERISNSSRKIFSYDADKRLIRSKSIYLFDITESEAIYEYSINDKITIINNLNSKGNLNSIDKYTYDQKGNNTIIKTFDALETLSFRVQKLYDVSNRLIETNIISIKIKFGEEVEIPISKETIEYIGY